MESVYSQTSSLYHPLKQHKQATVHYRHINIYYMLKDIANDFSRIVELFLKTVLDRQMHKIVLAENTNLS